MHPFETHVFDQLVIDCFTCNWAVLQNLWNMIRGGIDIRISKHYQRAHGGAGHQTNYCLQDCDASPLGAYQGASYVKAIFREQLIEVIAGNAARDGRIAFANQAGISITQAFQSAIYFAASSTGRD